MRDGYDHSYNFVSTFMAQHIAWHAERLNGRSERRQGTHRLRGG